MTRAEAYLHASFYPDPSNRLATRRQRHRQTGHTDRHDRQRSSCIERTVFGRPFVKQFALCYGTVVLSCLSVTLVYCGQIVGRIKVKLGMQVGLGPGHTVLDGDQKMGQSPQLSAHVYCGQTAGWIKMPVGIGVGLGQGHIVLDGDPALPPPKGGHSPQFSAHVYCGKTAGWIKMPLNVEVGLGPGHIALDGDSLLPPQRGTAPHFQPISVVAKWLDGSRCHLAGRLASIQATLC